MTTFEPEQAAVVESADTPDSNSGPARGTGSSPVGGTYSDYERVRYLEAAIEDLYLRVFK